MAEAFSGLLEQTSKYGGWDLIGQGSVDVALSLLDFNAPFKPKMCQAVWGCAKKILSSVVALRPEPVREILTQVRSRTPIFRLLLFSLGTSHCCLPFQEMPAAHAAFLSEPVAHRNLKFSNIMDCVKSKLK